MGQKIPGRKSCLILVAFGVVTIVAQTSFAGELEEKEKALKVIADFAERFCEDIPIEGGNQGIELTGKAKAELNGIISKLVSIGVEGAAKYKDNRYKGPLQKDLANSIKNSTDCRLTIWKDLKDRILGRQTDHSASSGIATKKYWDSVLSIEVRNLSKAIDHQNKASKLIRENPFNVNQFIQYAQSSASFTRKYIKEVENLSSLDVDPELVALTQEGIFLAMDWASEMSTWASLWERSDYFQKNNMQEWAHIEHGKTMDRIVAIVNKLNRNSSEYRLLRSKLVDKYQIELSM